MILSLIQRQRFLIFGLIFALLITGLACVEKLPVEPVPDISPRQVMVTVTAPGLATEEVEKLITFPVETALTAMPGLQDLRSVSRTGVCVVYLQFDDATDIDLDRTRVAERLQAARENVAVPNVSVQMGPRTTGMGEIMQFQLKGPAYSLMDLNRIMRWTVAPAIKLLPGIAEVNINGGAEQTFQVTLDPLRLRTYGVTVADVAQAVDRNNSSAGGGWIAHQAEQQVIVGRALVGTLDDFGLIPVRIGQNGQVIRIRDVGSVGLGPRTRLGAATRDGQGEIVLGAVMMQDGASSNAVLGEIHNALPSIRKALPAGVVLEPYYMRSTLTEETISTVKENLLIGAGLVLVVLIVVLGDWRASLVIASAIPAALLSAFIGMRVFGVSANLLSLGAIDFGMIVDSSLVVVEHFMTLRANGSSERSTRETAIEAARAVIRPVTFSIFVIIMVYLPILTLEDIEGKMFRPMAQTVVMALLASLVYCFVCIPVLAAIFLRTVPLEQETWFVRHARRYYEPMLSWSERHFRPVLIITIGIFLFSVGLATRLGGEFVPTLEEGSLTTTVTRWPSASLPTVIEEIGKQERIIRSFPEVQTVVSNIGTPAVPTDPMGPNESDSFIILKPRSQWTTGRTQAELLQAMSDELQKKLPSANYEWSQPIQMRMDELLSGVRTQIAISIYGNDLEELSRLADHVTQVVSSVPGAADVAPQGDGTVPFMHIDVDRDTAARRGVLVSDVLDQITAIGGLIGKPVVLGNAIIPTQIRLDPASTLSVAAIGNLPIRRLDGRGWVLLSDVARLQVVDGPSRIDRDRLQRRVIIQANVRGRDIGSFVADAQKAVAREVKLPPGYDLAWAGQFQNMNSAMKRLGFVVPVALLIILALLVVALGSFKAAALVFVNLPIAATGGVIALTLRGLPFSIAASIGFIALFGVAILNGVVLVSQIKTFEEAGRDAAAAAFEAARSRFRPVIATASVASLGFFPMAFSGSMGAEVERPLATVVIGGLVTSTLLTLLVLPTLYARLFRA
ncbi:MULTISPECIES: efflux RND transporter permease subunit [Gluconobacter]|nr:MULTISPECIES: CusA/CzcA family heavy metal efflux RND transporter [Gluconobacter]KXV02982.1 cobalt transporter [Gluconobacter potus]MBS1023100.1 efflux RND transporter permease subunit [Gluconobacter cerinus]MBS1025546.1 efflux RND transporter permease subunit [Gluconobacter cerinus]MBS1029615.1 efflux RND transporter permease subunit [Gluconobacter albidus]MBS1031858.1 efflux RND transporter permease subunit [Gluconobacter cerinus]